mmetsp:Transcript_16893/g.51114  ORF Transcript_16893/g.51114 Transcript_16893/m.51114 type:complete len:99 (+) Transcript_16893:1721-2017(+)
MVLRSLSCLTIRNGGQSSVINGQPLRHFATTRRCFMTQRRTFSHVLLCEPIANAASRELGVLIPFMYFMSIAIHPVPASDTILFPRRYRIGIFILLQL